MTYNEKTKLKNYIHMINLAVVAERSLDVYSLRENCELYEKSIKSLL